MATGKTPYQKRMDGRRAEQTKEIKRQDAEIRKNRREGRGGIKEKGLLGFFQTLSELLLGLLGGVDTPGSSQGTLPYVRMYRGGMCEVEPGLYSRTIQFYDINYRLSKDEWKNKVFKA